MKKAQTGAMIGRRWAAFVVLAAAVFCGFRVTPDSYIRFVTVLTISAAAVVALNFQFRYGFLAPAALILTGVAFPIEFMSVPNGSLNAPFLLAAFFCISWLLSLAIWPEKSRIEPSRVVAAAAALMAVALVSFAAGQFPWASSSGAPLRAQLAGLCLYLLSGGIFLAAGHVIGSLSQLRRLTWLFLAAGGAFCISQAVPALDRMVRWSIPDSVGSIFWIWLVALSCGQALFNRDLSKRTRFILVCVAALALFRGIFLASSWASGWLPPLAAVCVLLSIRFRRTAIGMGIFALPLGLMLAGKAVNLLMGHEHYSYVTRLEAWRVMLQLVWKSPVLGLGPANYYHYTLMYPILGWYVRFSSHNNYMDLLAQTGFLGLVAFCWFAAEIGCITWRLCSKAPDGFSRAYAAGVLGGLAGSLAAGMLADWIIPFVYNVGIRGFRSSFLFWLFLGGVLALKRITRTQAVMDASEVPGAIVNPVMIGGQSAVRG